MPAETYYWLTELRLYKLSRFPRLRQIRIVERDKNVRGQFPPCV